MNLTKITSHQISLSLALLLGMALTSALGVEAGKARPPDLTSLTLHDFSVASGSVTLTRGVWEGPPFMHGGVSRPRLELVQEAVLSRMGESGRTECFVFVVEGTGALRDRLHLVALRQQGSQWVQVSVQDVGEAVQVRSARLEGPNVVVETVEPGQADALCCPGDMLTREWRLEGDRLAEMPSGVPPDRLTLDLLSGSRWILIRWDANEPAPERPVLQIEFTEDGAIGKSGCNRFFADAEEGSEPGDIDIGNPGSTRMVCDAAVMAVEDRFLQTLDRVNRWGFSFGRLVLTYQDGPALRRLFFRLDNAEK